MNRIKYYGMIIVLLFTALSFNACSSDDDIEIANLESYIKGKWHSYRAVVSANNESIEVPVTKTGQYSAFYWEIIFKEGNKVDMSYYEEDTNGNSRWMTETNSYSVKGDVVTIYDSENSIDFIFDPGSKTMYMRAAGQVDNIGYTTVFIHLCK